MTLQEAYVKAKMSDKDYENAYLIECTEYVDFWVFSFSPEPYNSKRIWVGGYIKVDKKTEEVRGIAAPEVMGLKGKNIPLERLNGLIRPVEKTTKKQDRAPRVAVAS
jgi:hypothetical protein